MESSMSILERMLGNISRLELSYEKTKLSEAKLQKNLHRMYILSQELLVKVEKINLEIQNDLVISAEAKAKLFSKQIDINQLEKNVSSLLAQKKDLKRRMDRTIKDEQKLAKLKADVMVEKNRINAFTNRKRKGWGR